MPGYLKQATASQSRAIGPFVDDTDFKTAETGLTIANTDIKLIVNGAASANKNSGGGTHRANGVYGITFDATDTATVGEMQVSVVVAGALPVFDKFFVLEEAVYDALFAASAPGYGTAQTGDSFARLGAPAGASVSADVAAVKAETASILTDTAEIGAAGAGLTVLATAANLATVAGYLDTEIASIISTLGTPAGASVSADIAAVKVDTAAILVDTGTTLDARIPAALVGGRMDVSVGAMAADVVTAAAVADGAIDRATFAADTGMVSIRSNTAQAGAATTITLDASASAVTDFYKNALIVLTGGTGAGQGRYCTAYNGTTKVATVSAWATNPDVTSTFAIIAADAIVGATAPTAVQVADEVQTRTIAAVTVVNGMAADSVTASALAADAVAEIQSGIATAANLATVAGYLDTEIAAILADTNELQTDWANGGRLDLILDARASQTTADAIEADTQDIQSRIPAALSGGNMTVDVLAISGSAAAADNLEESTEVIGYGTATTGGTTTSVVASGISPTSAVNDQYNGRVMIFKGNVTGALAGQATTISDYDHATQTFTVVALTTSPASGDLFTIL